MASSLIPALIAIVFMFSGCATTVPAPQAPAPREVAQESAQAGLIHECMSKIAERDRALQSMQTEAVMQYSAPDKHSPKVREQITARRPDSLRVEAAGAFSVALILAASGQNLTIFEPSNNKLIHAAATADALNQFIQIPMAPADAVTLLLGIAPDSSALAGKNPDFIANEGAMTVGSWIDEDSSRRELGFQDERLAMMRTRAANGSVQYEVRYSDYHDIGGIMFPYAIEADFPAAQSHVSLRYKRPIINGDVPLSAFILPPPADQQANLSNASH
jgi:hypothetical protein